MVAHDEAETTGAETESVENEVEMLNKGFCVELRLISEGGTTGDTS